MKSRRNSRNGYSPAPAVAKQLATVHPVRTFIALTIFIALMACSSIAQQVNFTVPVQSRQAEYKRMIEGLRKARPMPDPVHGITPHALTEAGGLVHYDPKTGKSVVDSAAKFSADAIENGNGSEPGHAGSPLGSPNGRVSPAARGVGGQATGLAPDFNTNPNPPHIDGAPYSLPFNAEYQLLMRFAVPGADDQFYLCSATTASDFHLLSAGHCIYNHDPLGDGSGRGAGFASEVWAWPAQTDVVDPVYDNGWTDFPYGVSKMTWMTTYNAWINSSDFNWDFSFITLDRRIGDLTGWPGREWGVEGTSLAFAGYPAEAPFVPSDNPFLYVGLDNNNVVGYTTNRIQMSAFTYGGMSGGGVFRFDGNAYVLQGVNSTSNRAGSAFATRYTGQTSTDLKNTIAADRAARLPVDQAAIIEYQFNDSSKDLPQTSVQPGDFFDFKLNALNAGFITDPNVVASVFLVKSLFSEIDTGIFCGTTNLGALSSFQFTVQTHQFRVPSNTPPGEYYVGWVLGGTASEYTGNRQQAIFSKKKLSVVGLSSTLPITINPSTVTAGGKATGTIILTDPAPADGLNVTLSSNNGAVQVPFLVQVKPTAILAEFPITTTSVSAPVNVTITAEALNSTQTGTIKVNPLVELTTSTLVSSLNPSTLGQNVIFTGTVHGSVTTPTGSVKLMHGTTQLATAALTGGVAHFNIANLPVGVNALTLVYSGDAKHKTSTSPVLNQKVLDTTAATLASTPNPSAFGQAVTFTATVQGQKSTPTGQVQLKRGSTVMATATLAGAKATFTVTNLPQGTSAMAVTYLGDTNHAAKTSAAINQTVKFVTTTHLTASTLSAAKGTKVTLTAKLNPAAATGTVTFRAGAIVLGKVGLSGGAASFSVVPVVGSHSFTAVYSGDARNAASTSAAVMVTIH